MTSESAPAASAAPPSTVPATAVVSVNGRITSGRDAVVPVFDHGFLYGEGVYETLRTYRRRPFLFAPHMARMRRSAELLGLALPDTDGDMLARVDEALTTEGGTGEAYIRILLTRGVGDLSYDPAACPTPTLVVIVKPLVPFAETTFRDGIRVALVDIRRNHPDALNPLIKSNNLINNALAMQEAMRRGAAEAVMLNQAGELAECSQSNIFIVRGGEALTPPLTAGLLPGITRAYVLELAAEGGVPARETRLTPDDLAAADEVFITGTTREVTPVVAVDERPVGSGRPGAITRQLLAEYRRRV